MRFAPRRGFLYPVLGQRGYYYPDGSFRAEAQAEETGGNPPKLKLGCSFECDVGAINGLVAQHLAVCAVWVYCSATSYRHLFSADAGKTALSGEIDLTCLSGEVELHPLIVAVENLVLPLEDAHSAFGSEPLRLTAGSPLAVHQPIYTAVDHIPSDDSAKSIFQLAQDDNIPEGAWDARYDSEQFITLAAHPGTWKIVNRERTTSTPDGNLWTLQALFLPALADALAEYLRRATDRREEDRPLQFLPEDTARWTGAITRTLRNSEITLGDRGFRFGGEPRSVLWTAQHLLKNPLRVSPLMWAQPGERRTDG